MLLLTVAVQLLLSLFCGASESVGQFVLDGGNTQRNLDYNEVKSHT